MPSGHEGHLSRNPSPIFSKNRQDMVLALFLPIPVFSGKKKKIWGADLT